MQRSDTTFRPGAQGREWDEMVKRVVADNRRNVLDWGAGYGQVTARLIVRGVAVTSYEFRPDVPTGVAQFDSFPSLRYDHSSDPVRLPYLDETFDAVLSSGVLEHVSNPEQSLEEIRRVLQPGGRLYVYKLPNESSWLEWIARRAGMDYHGMPERPYDRLYTVESARALVAAHGFRVVEARLANILPLTVGPYRSRPIAVVWRANRALGRVPGLRRLATNVQVIAERA